MAELSDVETLREAARQMRERAEAATDGGGWTFYPGRDGMEGEPGGAALITHIQSWSPAVALTVAGLLEEVAEDWRLDVRPQSTEDAARTVARAYLRIFSW